MNLVHRFQLHSLTCVFTYGLLSEGASLTQLEQASFKIDFFASGKKILSDEKSDNSKSAEAKLPLHTVVTGPELGYVATPIFLIESAILVRERRLKAPSLMPEGGVLTPGSVFANLYKTELVPRLQSKGIEFKVVNNTWTNE